MARHRLLGPRLDDGIIHLWGRSYLLRNGKDQVPAPMVLCPCFEPTPYLSQQRMSGL